MEPWKFDIRLMHLSELFGALGKMTERIEAFSAERNIRSTEGVLNMIRQLEEESTNTDDG